MFYFKWTLMIKHEDKPKKKINKISKINFNI